MIASSMEPVLTDGRVIRKLKAQSGDIVAKMQEFLSDMAERIRSFYARLNPDSVEGQQIARMKDRMEQIEDIWTEALEESSERYR